MRSVFACIAFLAQACAAQAHPPIELYGPVYASQVYDSLGTNINGDDEWQYQAAQAAHITWGRFDCPWGAVEIQSLPQNTSDGFRLPLACASGLAYGKIYNVRTIMDALYGAPYSKVATALTAADATRGSTSLSLNVISGSLKYVIPAQSYVKIESRDISSKHAYAGTLITGISGNRITLASALTSDIAAGSSVVLNLQLYAPVLIPPGAHYLSNPSIRAFEAYVRFLQTQVASRGVPGRVSIWNEPPWKNDPWDDAANLYDSPPEESRLHGKLGVELAFAALTLPTMPSVPLDNGYTNKTASGSLLHPDYLQQLKALPRPSQSFASESFHPYGNNPEDDAWNPSCIQAHKSPSEFGTVYRDCTPVGANMSGNTKWQAAFSAPQDGSSGLALGITETGLGRGIAPFATETQISRFDLRQFLVFAGSGVHPILFYRLAEDPHLEWLHSDHSPYPVYTAFRNLMADIHTIAHDPVEPYSPSRNFPAVTSYVGSYPLATVVLVGSRAGDKANSMLVYVWQRSYSSGKWVDLPSPTPADTTLSIPSGVKIAFVKDTVTSAPIPSKVCGDIVTFSVTDNPVEILFIP